MDVFAYSTYKEFFKAFIANNNTRGFISQLALACGCDRTYVSQVLNGKADLTPDHLIQFCENFGFKGADMDYLLTLLLRDRSASSTAKKIMDEKLKKAKAEARTVSGQVYNREKPKEISESQRTLYYSNWVYGAIHILTSIEDYQSPATIASKLNLPLTTVNGVLKDLVEMGLVHFLKGKYTHSGGDIYLPGHYPQIASHHLGWRMKAVERSHEKKDIHYTLAFSVSEKDVEELRVQILNFIEKQRQLIRDSGSEVACAICLDFFEM